MTAKETIKEIMSEVSAYLDDKGMPRPSDRMVDHYLSLAGLELKEMSNEDLAIASYEISCKSAYIHDFVNEKKTKWEACQQQIMKTVGQKVNEYNAYYFKDKLYLACMDNEYAEKLHKLQSNIDLILIRCDGISKKLDSVAYAISTILKQRDNENAR